MFIVLIYMTCKAAGEQEQNMVAHSWHLIFFSNTDVFYCIEGYLQGNRDIHGESAPYN